MHPSKVFLLQPASSDVLVTCGDEEMILPARELLGKRKTLVSFVIKTPSEGTTKMNTLTVETAGGNKKLCTMSFLTICDDSIATHEGNTRGPKDLRILKDRAQEDDDITQKTTIPLYYHLGVALGLSCRTLDSIQHQTRATEYSDLKETISTDNRIREAATQMIRLWRSMFPSYPRINHHLRTIWASINDEEYAVTTERETEDNSMPPYIEDENTTMSEERELKPLQKGKHHHKRKLARHRKARRRRRRSKAKLNRPRKMSLSIEIERYEESLEMPPVISLGDRYIEVQGDASDNQEDIQRPEDGNEHIPHQDMHSISAPENAVEESSVDISESTDESSQHSGVIRLEKHQIEVRVPPSEHLRDNDITVRAITEVPPELACLLKENEAIICVGLEMLPSDATFSTPVKVTMPHSAIFTKPENAPIGMYYRKSSNDSFSVVNEDPRCVVRERDLDLYFDHFCEWWIFAYISGVCVGKRVMCTPYVPVSAPRNAEHLLRLCIRDINTGKEEFEAEYVAPIKGHEFVVAWGSGDLKVTCKADHKDVGTEELEEYLFRNSENKIPFLVNTSGTDKSKVFVEFILKQRATMRITCPLSLSGGTPEVHLLEPSASVILRVHPNETESKPASTLKTSEEVSDGKLDTLAEHVPPGKYSNLSVKLGIDFNQASGILNKHSNDSTKAIRECLNKWKNRTGGSSAELKRILDRAEVGGTLARYIE